MEVKIPILPQCVVLFSWIFHGYHGFLINLVDFFCTLDFRTSRGGQAIEVLQKILTRHFYF